MDPRLAVVTGPLSGRTYPLTEAEFSIGRGASNQLCVTDRLMSRLHCLIRRDPDGFTIRDLDSRNGTFVNGVPVTERPLKHGDQISIAASVFVFLVDDGVPPAPALAVTL